MILTPTIGAVLYQALGRNPWIGIVTGYAAAAAGFTANLFPGNTDVLLSTISNGVASKLGFEVNALSNYYFLCLGTSSSRGPAPSSARR
jgi:aminobenzoyl-glutamate transport protein